PCARATAAVRSVEPSSTTTTSNVGSNARSSPSTPPSAPSSLRAGTIAMRRASGTGPLRDAEAEQLEHAPCPVRVRVLVEHALAGAATHRLGLRRVGGEPAVGGERGFRVV